MKLSHPSDDSVKALACQMNVKWHEDCRVYLATIEIYAF